MTTAYCFSLTVFRNVFDSPFFYFLLTFLSVSSVCFCFLGSCLCFRLLASFPLVMPVIEFCDQTVQKQLIHVKM